MNKTLLFLVACLSCQLPHIAQAQLAADASLAETATPAGVTDLQVRGIVKTLQQFPEQAETILQNYLGLDTSRVDLAKLDALIASGDTGTLQQQISALSTHRDAFNAGLFQDVAFYRDPAAVTTDVMAAATPIETAAAPDAAGAEKMHKAQGQRSWLEHPYSGTVAGVAVATAVGVAIASGGGGGGNDDDTATPPTTPDAGRDVTFGRTSLPDLYTPASFVDAEFNAYPLDALTKQNAQYAYAKGLNGSGVKIGLFDYFSTDASADSELAARVVYRNLDFAADNAVLAGDCAASGGDPAACDHGRVVMRYAAAARDGAGTQGVAYGASLMMESAGPAFSTPTTLANNGANIINFSCGGCLFAPLSELQYLADRDIFMSAATGNDDFGVGPAANSPAVYASQLDYSMIAVTGVYEVGGVISNLSYNNCGSQSEFCMAAYSDAGTSFAAPQVAGAAALLKQGWSFLTAKEIGQILLYTAKDIGAAGVDPVYGHGLLDIRAAVNPAGTLSVLNGAGQRVNYIASTITQNRGSAFGDAFATSRNATRQITGIDSFGRNFAIASKDRLSVASTDRFSADRIAAFGRTAAPRTVVVSDRLRLQYNRAANNTPGAPGMGDVMSYADYAVTPSTRIQMGFASDINMLPADRDDGVNPNNFLTPEPLRNGYLNLSDNDQVLHQAVSFAPTTDIDMNLRNYYSRHGTANYFMPNSDDGTVKNDFTASILETRFHPADDVTTTWSNGVTHEFNSVLGTRTTGSFALQDGANTYFTGIDTAYDVSPDWTLGAAYMVGRTQARPAALSAYSDVSDILSDSFNVTATRKELLGRDALSLSVGQPTRVRSGAAHGLTQQVDASNGTVQTVGFQQDLTPTGRTLQFQLAYQRALSDDIALNMALAHEQQPYQQRDSAAETSGLAKLVYRLR